MIDFFHCIDCIGGDPRQRTCHYSGNRMTVVSGNQSANDQCCIAVSLNIKFRTFLQFFPVEIIEQIFTAHSAADTEDHIDFRIVPCCIKVRNFSCDRSVVFALFPDKSVRHDFDFIACLAKNFNALTVHL